MNIPNKRTIAYAIARLIHEKGPLTEHACVHALSNQAPRHIGRALKKMCADRLLIEVYGVYSLPRRLHDYFEFGEENQPTKAQPVLPPYRPERKEWTGKYNISAAPRRDDAEPLRDIHFIYGDTVLEPFRGRSM